MKSFSSTNCEPVVIKIMNDDDIIIWREMENGEHGESRGIDKTARCIHFDDPSSTQRQKHKVQSRS